MGWINSGISRVFRVLSYSTKTSPSKIVPDTLPIRVPRNAAPKASILPILNQWLQEGKPIKQSLRQTLIRQLRRFRRYNHALQVSEYMSEEMKYDISIGDMAVRLNLISKVHGIDEAEKYFDSLPETMKTFQVYGNYEMLDVLMQEMKEKGSKHDSFTNNIRLNAYASSSDIEGMEKFLAKIENESSIDWHAYVVAANAYLKAGITEKALQMLNRAEQLVTSETRRHAYEIFLSIYTNLGRKDEVYRIWKLYGKFLNSGYLCMIGSLTKLDDLDGAEKILAEWESGQTVYDARIPNLMISAYCKKGLIGKAEPYTNRLIERGVIKESDAFILNSLATGYQIDGQTAKAAETLKKAILASISGWKPNLVTLAACLRFLKGENNIEAAEELLQLLRVRCHLSTDVYDRLV
ncbi:hypothetical protein REPUB_Repub04eG0136900 [Reevesia pubescens]